MWKETGPVKNNVGKRETAEYKHLLFHIFFPIDRSKSSHFGDYFPECLQCNEV